MKSIHHRLIVPMQARGNVGKSTTLGALGGWLEQHAVQWRGFDLDPDHRSFARLFPEKVALAPLGDEPESDLIKLLRGCAGLPITVIDPRAHLSEILIRGFELIRFPETFAEADGRVTVLLFPADDLEVMTDMDQTVSRLGGTVDYVVVKNRARAPRTRMFDGSELAPCLRPAAHERFRLLRLSLSAKGLGAQWQERHGYEPLLAETFVDVERFAGTCYRAAGWQELGLTEGNRRSADYYVPNERPKQLWVKPLVGDARGRLCAAEVGAAQKDGLHAAPVGVMPLRQPELESLHEALRRVPDPRRYNRRHRSSTVLTIVCLGLLMGQRRVMDFVRLATQLNHRQRELLWYYKAPGKKVGIAPGKDVFYLLLRSIDPNELAAVLNGWLAVQQGKLPSSLALDGKVVGERLAQIVSLVDAESGAPVAQGLMSDQTGGETYAGQRLLASQELDGVVITADAGHTNHETPRIIVEAGADYVLQIKGNTPAVKKSVQARVERRPPFLPKPRSVTGA